MLVSTTVVSTRIFRPLINDTLLLSDLNQAPMQFRDHFSAEDLCDPRERLRIRQLTETDAGEVTVGEAHPHFPLQHIEAPVADVLEEQEAKKHFGRCLRPAFGGTIFVPSALRFKHL